LRMAQELMSSDLSAHAISAKYLGDLQWTLLYLA
jgi:hypothetical protein